MGPHPSDDAGSSHGETNPSEWATRSRRRDVLRTLGAGAVVTVAGCLGGSGDDSDGGDGGDGGGSGGTASPTVTGSGPDLADELIVQMSGGHYHDSYSEQVFGRFEDEFGVDIEVALVSNQFDGYTNIKTGQSDADITITSASTLYQGTVEEVWAPVDPADVPNTDGLLETFQNPIYDPGEDIHAIPTVYGTIGMAYNRDELGELDSWAATWDPAYDGRVTMEGFGFVRVFTTALHLGMDPNDIGAGSSYESEIEEIWDAVREQKELVTTYWTSGDEHVRLFSQEQALVGEAWGGRIFGAVQDGYEFLDYVVPREGAYGWSDNWVMVRDLDEQKRRTALTYFNFLLREDVIVPLTEMLGYPPATDATSSGIEDLYDYDPSGGERLIFQDPGYRDEHDDEWSQTWEEIQAG